MKKFWLIQVIDNEKIIFETELVSAIDRATAHKKFRKMYPQFNGYKTHATELKD